jgi:F-type H+-transporting ATPase subunit epsilon
MSFTVRVYTPEKIELDTTCDRACIPAINGSLTILSRHAPLVSVLKTGVLKVNVDGIWTSLIIVGGFSEVIDDLLIVLALGVQRLRSDETEEEILTGIEKASSNLKMLRSQSQDPKNDSRVFEAIDALNLAEARLEAFQCQ